MNRCLTSAFFASALVYSATAANAAPLSAPPASQGASSAVELVHGGHRSCRSGHRHSRDGGRTRCGYYHRDSGPGVTIQLGSRRDRHHNRRHRDHDRRDRR